ncbi:DUF1145 domain-containing protein [Vibrio agarivorans]|uniref:DUF1145 domain-containing protein n=1 Tax=Vibrio agarivorans TaxID=153622 RepID=A0ABT7Y2T4_9VIBR|nr:DUF1145 domain-containing protein [Vibrio agarivorans]MDN2482333.1 DUF1145 domain-containing protein [Vibrio agarivorans]
MTWLILLAKGLFLAVWGVLFSNFFTSYPHEVTIVLFVILGFMILMHAMQAAVFITALRKRVPLTLGDKLSLLVFGVFGLLGIKYKYADQMSDTSS